MDERITTSALRAFIVAEDSTKHRGESHGRRHRNAGNATADTPHGLRLRFSCGGICYHRYSPALRLALAAGSFRRTRGGILGALSEVQVWTNRKLRYIVTPLLRLQHCDSSSCCKISRSTKISGAEISKSRPGAFGRPARVLTTGRDKQEIAEFCTLISLGPANQQRVATEAVAERRTC
jgi:hypothetical protein